MALIKCVSFQSTPLNIYQDHVWHFSYLLAKNNPRRAMWNDCEEGEKDAFIRACWRRWDGRPSKPGPACNRHQRSDIGRWRWNKITTSQVGVECMTKPDHPPPHPLPLCHCGGKLPVWRQTSNIPSSCPFGWYNSTALLIDSVTEAACRRVTLGLKQWSWRRPKWLWNTRALHSRL